MLKFKIKKDALILDMRSLGRGDIRQVELITSNKIPWCKEFVIEGTPEALYGFLHELSYIFDIEIN